MKRLLVSSLFLEVGLVLLKTGGEKLINELYKKTNNPVFKEALVYFKPEELISKAAKRLVEKKETNDER